MESGRRKARARSTPESASPTRPSASQTLESESWLTSAKAGRTSSLIESDCSSSRSAVTRSPRSNATRPCVRTASTIVGCAASPIDSAPLSACSARCSASVSRPSTHATQASAPVSATCCRFGAASGSKVCSQISRAPLRSPSHSRVRARRMGPYCSDLVVGEVLRSEIVGRALVRPRRLLRTAPRRELARSRVGRGRHRRSHRRGCSRG